MPGIRVVQAVTSPLTLILMRGQLACIRKAGFEVFLISAPEESIWSLDRFAKEQGVEAVPVEMARGLSPLRDLGSAWSLYGVLRRLRPDIVNAGTPKAGLLVGIAAWLARVPCRIHTLRGLRSETATGATAVFLSQAERIACRTAHRVICNSASLRDRAVALGIVDRKRCVVLGSGSSNGVDAARFQRSPEALARSEAIRDSLEIPKGAPVIGFVGRLTRDKGIIELIAAFDILAKRYPELRLLLIGVHEQDGSLPAAIIERFDRDPRVICTGAVPDAAPYYALMTAYALPTYREGFPNSVLEAQAAGLPVVTTRATGAVDSIVDGITGMLVAPRDPQGLAAALQRLLDDAELATRMGHAGRERVARDFRPEAIWDGLVGVYRDLLREHGITGTAGAAVSTR